MDTVADRNRWAIQHADCGVAEPYITSIEQARFILATHAGHGARCLQYIAAMAYSFGQQEHYLDSLGQ
ncbi:hypothetical protein IU459_29100 [Nocardia amamiensis]|uniref:Uncharacterized protein n=1 Tax=Nocardia amamiensis TaxID=404578 RepID=A0ABS0CYA5_9NOCA|nr:hypothetical protein [Nocardia amamiensis]MBF6301566.1 hypothetical protein [Nocardia amamiensis]